MDADQPGLFHLPDPEPGSPERPRRGRNREVWGLTATAEVTITHGSALQAAARSNEGFVITVGADLGVEDAEPEAPEAAPGDDVFDALAWLIWPSDGLEEVLDAGALRILSVESEAKGDSVDHGTATWKVTAKITDVEELRRLAARASPDEAAEISASLAARYRRASDRRSRSATQACPGANENRPRQATVTGVR